MITKAVETMLLNIKSPENYKDFIAELGQPNDVEWGRKWEVDGVLATIRVAQDADSENGVTAERLIYIRVANAQAQQEGLAIVVTSDWVVTSEPISYNPADNVTPLEDEKGVESEE